MNAVSYIRVSSTKQLDGDGPERQRAGTSAFPGFEIVREFVDDISGTKAVRPAFDEMLAYCKEHSIETVLVDKTDRFTRDLYVGLQLIGECASAGLNVIDCSTAMSVTRPKNKIDKYLVRQLMLVAELAKDMIVENLAVARKRVRDSGRKCEGRKGYRDLPQFSVTMQRIRQLSTDGLGPTAIANQLNIDQVPTMNGRPWKKGTVQGLLGSGTVFSTEST